MALIPKDIILDTRTFYPGTGKYGLSVLGWLNEAIDAGLIQTDLTTSNVGSGIGLALPKDGFNFPFKSLVAGTNVTITAGAEEVEIKVASGAGATASEGITITAADIQLGDSNSGSGSHDFTTDRYQYLDTFKYQVDSSTISGLFTIDGGNDRIGVRQSVPLASLHIHGEGLTSGTSALFIDKSDGTNIMDVRDDGLVKVKSTVADPAIAPFEVENYILFKPDNLEQSVYLGRGSGASIVALSAIGNTVVGDGAGSNITTGDDLTLIGVNVASNMTTARQNTFVGADVATNMAVGDDNTGIGDAVLNQATNCARNVAIGIRSMINANDAYGNVAVGSDTLENVDTNGYNTAVGSFSGVNLTTPTNSAFFGTYSGNAVTTGDQNTLIGAYAGTVIDTGSQNILLGRSAGGNITTGDHNIMVGYNIHTDAVSTSNFMSLGNLIYGTGVTSGGTASSGKVGIKIRTPLRDLDVDDMRLTNFMYNDSDDMILIGEDAGAFYVIADGGGASTKNINIGHSSSNLILYDAASHRFDTGSVGIGITPTAKLHVYEDVDAPLHLYVQNPNTGISSYANLNLLSDTSNSYMRVHSSTHSVWPDATVYYSNASNGWHFFNAASSNIEFWTNSTQRVVIEGGGDVGIGTTSPSAKLHVNGGDIYAINSGGDARFLLGEGLSVGQYGGMRWRNSGNYLQVSADSIIGSFSNGLTLLGTGEVGVGTNNPLYLFDVYDSTTNALTSAIRNVDNTGNADALLLISVGGTSAGDAYTRYTVSGGSTWSTGIDNSLSDSYKIQPATWPGGSSVGLTMTTAGNVGIGTSSPASHSFLSPGKVFHLQDTSTNLPHIRIEATSNEGLLGSDNSNVYLGSDGGVSIRTNGNQRIFIDSSGNVGFDDYGGGTITGTETYYAAFDTNGDIIEIDPSDVGDLAPTTVTGTSYTVLVTERTILVDDDTAGAAVTINLPAGTAGKRFWIKKLGTTGSVTVDGNGTENIDNSLTVVLNTQYESIMIESDGSDWWIIN